MRILLAEDEKELSNALVAILKHSNYSVDAVYDGADALDYALVGEYDALILDIMMPKMDGLTVLKTLRQKGRTTPVLLLTAKSQLQDIIAGLDTGADDYLTKPFAMGELLARLRAICRRQPEFAPNTLQCGNLFLNRENFELSTDQKNFRLSGKEYQIMELLMSNPGRLISTEQFLEKIWGYDAEAEISVVWVYLSNLRKKLSALAATVQIKATRGAGYLLEEIK
ncbi:MAG: response regulator transcription factor [Oscillospiraceae bacterium]|nr:response regulator transcription factor [Oscillospiraceae bacterium]